jgi:hypothetical protein
MNQDADPDPDIFITDFQDTNLKKSFSADYFLKVPHLHHFSKIRSQKEVTKQ